MTKQKKTIYSVHPAVKKMQEWTTSLPVKTGASLEQWIARVIKEGPQSNKERRAWLKEHCGLGTMAATWVADYADGKSPWEADPASYLLAAEGYVEQMFSGPKIALRPIYDKLLTIAFAIAPDVKACPCKTIVPLYHHHVFAQIKPSTQKRIDLGFALGDKPFTKRLIDTGGKAKKDRITHAIAITQLSDIDDEVIDLLHQSYFNSK
jgi:hypothetical protein